MKKFFLLLVVALALGGGYYALVYQTPQEKHFAAALQAARQGNIEAQVQTAYAYANGEGVTADGKQALYWFRQAALSGDSEALWKCAESYIQGKLVAQDLEEAVPFLLLAANQGSVPAQRELVRFYAQGLGGLPVHEGESLYWQFMAAKMGDESARRDLHSLKETQPQLYEQMEQFLSDLKSAQEGDGPARVRVGKAYLTGETVLANAEKSEQYLTSAWQENKDPQAGLLLAQNYQSGAVFPADETKANTLWSELAGQAYAPAQYALGEMAYQANPPKYEDAFAWFSNAASGGYAPAQYMTGFMLMQGEGTAKSVPLAITFFRNAAEQNYVSAQYVLGQIYYKGLGVPADKKAGRTWLEKAAANGSEAAQALLETN